MLPMNGTASDGSGAIGPGGYDVGTRIWPFRAMALVLPPRGSVATCQPLPETLRGPKAACADFPAQPPCE